MSSPPESLSAHLRRLQEEGHGVLCISGSGDGALDAADVGVGIIADAGGCSTWSADLLCGPGLEDAWRVLGVLTAARPLTERVVHVAQAATALGTLLALVGGRRRGGKTHAVAPVHTSALLGLYQGARVGRRATRRRAPAHVIHVPWHALDPPEVLERVDEVSARNRAGTGVSLRKAVRQAGGQARRAAGRPLPRRLLAPVTQSYALAVAVREELADPLTPVLALGATASAIVGSAVDAALVGTVLTGNAFVSGAQRWRAERSLNRLLVEQTVTAHRVRRSTREAPDVLRSAAQDPDEARERLESLPLKKVRGPRLVLGDVVSLRAGDVVPADARVVAAWDLEVDESSLTGESVPVHKDVEATPGAPLPERSCMVFEGTTVLAGTAYAVVVATGESTEAGRAARAAETTIFARVSPQQKVRIVEALRAAGRVVAMTGDGTNDAAAIRLADVGIGVGAAGSTAARSSADLVLAEPDLPRIHDALVEGRQMWHRMREAVSILVGGNAGEMAFMMLGTAVGGRAPINIRQMLVVNLLTDMFPALAVALAPGRSPQEVVAPVGSTLGRPLARAIAIRGATTALGATLAWTVGRYTGRGRRADTMGLAALVGTQLGQTLLIGWRSPLVVATTLGSVAALLLVVETPGVSQLFGCTPIGPFAWTVGVGSSAVGTGAAALAQRRLTSAEVG